MFLKPKRERRFWGRSSFCPRTKKNGRTTKVFVISDFWGEGQKIVRSWARYRRVLHMCQPDHSQTGSNYHLIVLNS